VHVALFGKRVDFGEAEIAALVHGPADAACWSADEQALIGLIDDLVDHRTILDATWQAASKHFDEAQLIEAIAIVGFYHTISFLCRGLNLPLESYSARFPSA
jgi:alkylhydroperoxidase family enzyme